MVCKLLDGDDLFSICLFFKTYGGTYFVVFYIAFVFQIWAETDEELTTDIQRFQHAVEALYSVASSFSVYDLTFTSI